MNISPPRPKGPPLNALRAFEASARHGSFTAAASELCVTPGAIAQHIKALEHWSNAELFKRRAHGVELTVLGREILPGFISAFDQLGESVQSLRFHATPDQVRIAALPSIAQCWLSPRLPQVRELLPDVEISVYALETPPNLKRELFDINLFFEPLPGTEGNIEVAHDTIFPVCTAELATRLKTPDDLNHCTCLHDSQWSDDWQLWMSYVRPGQHIETDGPIFSLFSLALEEAKNGAGILMAHEALVQEQLISGELVAPFETKLKIDFRLAISTAHDLKGETLLQQIVQTLLRSDHRRDKPV